MPNILTQRITTTLAVLALGLPHPAFAQDVDFGDDSSAYAKDGECDDLRFEGSGMTDTILLESDVSHDATDCRIAFEQGRLTLAGAGETAIAGLELPIGEVNFGNDTGEYARDGECDDVRFVGEGMSVALLTDNIGKDATDCRSTYENGQIAYNALFAVPTDESPINYGDNTAPFANDGECDDIRFTGDYSSETIYIADDIGHDATDCSAAVDSGVARWQGNDISPNFGKEV